MRGQDRVILLALRLGELLGVVEAAESAVQARSPTRRTGNTTAAATTGPASGPQPASSTPATSVRPFCHSSRS